MTMKLYTTDNSDLMEISRIYPLEGNLVVEGTIDTWLRPTVSLKTMTE